MHKISSFTWFVVWITGFFLTVFAFIYDYDRHMSHQDTLISRNAAVTLKQAKEIEQVKATTEPVLAEKVKAVVKPQLEAERRLLLQKIEESKSAAEVASQKAGVALDKNQLNWKRIRWNEKRFSK